jgi:two-component system response regulator AtoC
VSLKERILVADDESSLRLLLNKELSRAGYSVEVAADGEVALKEIREKSYHVVLLDIVMPKLDGVSVLRTMKNEAIPSEVIILTGNATIESAIECMKLGAFEYVRKPYSLSELLMQIERAIERQRARLDIRMLREELKKSGIAGKLTGKSKAIQDLRTFIKRVAPTPSTVLILGESGSVKDKSFVTVNCASLSETLLESELFGYEKGAFTDAKSQKRGLAEIADGGTLFLDEIGEIPVHFQAKLLRFLETSEIRRVGGTKDISLNVRIICATNKPLEQLVQVNQFRADLYYRLNVLAVHVPPLRDHIDDIPALVEEILTAQSFNHEFSKEAQAALKNYSWPGNVRELKNVIERTCILCNEYLISAEDISFLKNQTTARIEEVPSIPIEPAFDSASLSLKEMERRHIINVLKYVDGHKGKASQFLQINPKTLYQKMKLYNIVSEYH